MLDALFPDLDVLAAVCRRHRISRLSLFGSTLKAPRERIATWIFWSSSSRKPNLGSSALLRLKSSCRLS